MLINLIAAAVGSGGANVTLSGEFITRIVTSPTNALSSVIVNTDGTVDKFSGSQSQIDSATDWIIPNSSASTEYEVRITNVVWQSSGDGESFSSAFEVEDTWKALTGNATWQITQSNDTGATKEVDFDLEIRLGSSGSAVATGAYTLRAVVQNP